MIPKTTTLSDQTTQSAASYDGFVSYITLDFYDSMMLNSQDKALSVVIKFHEIAQELLKQQIDDDTQEQFETYLKLSFDKKSINIRSLGHNEKNLKAVCLFSGRLYATCILNGFLVSGGVSYGSILFDPKSDLFTAKPLLLVQHMLKEAHWFGITIENTLSCYFDDQDAYESHMLNLCFKQTHIIQPYAIPQQGFSIKSSFKETYFAVAWPLLIDNYRVRFNSLSLDQFFQEFTDTYGPYSLCPHFFKQRFLHTFDFLQAVISA